jgi:choline dehydrogenase-like flavoprotein
VADADYDREASHHGPGGHPDASIGPDAYIDNFICNCVEARFHPSGTCQMGNDDNAVMNGEICVPGLGGASRS